MGRNIKCTICFHPKNQNLRCGNLGKSSVKTQGSQENWLCLVTFSCSVSSLEDWNWFLHVAEWEPRAGTPWPTCRPGVRRGLTRTHVSTAFGGSQKRYPKGSHPAALFWSYSSRLCFHFSSFFFAVCCSMCGSILHLLFVVSEKQKLVIYYLILVLL